MGDLNYNAYKSNPLLKSRGQVFDFTKEQVQEVIKCSQDPEYFLRTYIKVISLGDGIVPLLSLIHISEPTRQAESRMPSSA